MVKFKNVAKKTVNGRIKKDTVTFVSEIDPNSVPVQPCENRTGGCGSI